MNNRPDARGGDQKKPSGDKPDFDDDDIKIVDAIWDKIGRDNPPPDDKPTDKRPKSAQYGQPWDRRR